MIGSRRPPGPEQSSARWLPYVAIAAVCYVPLLLTQPGWINADTKSYLYIDPGRLLGRANSMWDPHIGLGSVSHQTIGYLWPMGPWFWAFEQLGVPDWVAQRLWWGTLLFAAATGVAFLLRRFDWPAVAIWPAALAYALTPYVLTHIGRLSGVLLPYSGLPWLLALTILALRSRGWRYPAAFALVVTTVGSVNLTALALAGIACLLWVAYALVVREVKPIQAAAAVGRIGLLTTLTSLWWLAGLSVQASHGIDIVRFTESAEVVARTSTAFEVLRGFGYWFFYGGDKLQLWTEASYDYLREPWLIAASFALPLVGLAAAVVTRWHYRRFFIVLLLAGAIVAIGAHPWVDPTPVGRVFKWFLGTQRGLAFRSLPRVVPLVALASAVLIGAGVAALAKRSRRAGLASAVAVALLAVLAMPPLWRGDLLGENLRRREIPEYWLQAAASIDARDDGTRVLELPGSDFASYRWGMTVDPITPGLVDRPYVARELVPHGGPMSADLLNAVDLRLQEGTLEPASIAPLARLLRAGDLVVRSDLEHERHSIVRPRMVWSLLAEAQGLGEPTGFGEPFYNEAGPRLQRLDEEWLLYESALTDPPPVALVPVEDVSPIISLQSASRTVVISGDGAGIVDAAAAGIVDGGELILYSGSLTPEQVRAELGRGAGLVVTDSNRKRGERWGTLRHNRGATERVDEAPLTPDHGDNRLERFPGAPANVMTVTEQLGGITADASRYGTVITYAAEERAAMAVDGDRGTAWSVGAFSDARGELLRLRLAEPRRISWIELQQLSEAASNRAISELEITLDGSFSLDVQLDSTSREEPGQRVQFDERLVSEIEIRIVADTAGAAPRFGAFGPVGLVEVVLGENPPLLDEWVRVPSDLVASVAGSSNSSPLTYVFTRLRQNPTDRTRRDEEREISRIFEVPDERVFAISGTARLSARAGDATLDTLVGQVNDAFSVVATDRMDGSRRERAAAAFDGDLATAWVTPWGQPVDHTLSLVTTEPTRFDDLRLEVRADGRHSVPSLLEVTVDGILVADVELDPVVDSEEPGHTEGFDISIPPTVGSELALRIVEAREVTSIDWQAGKPLAHPIAVAELSAAGLGLDPPAAELDTGCRDDLLSVDGEAIPLRIHGPTDAALDGDPLLVETCGATDLSLAPGEHRLRAARGVETGLDLDQLVLHSSSAGAVAAAAAPVPDLVVVDSAPDSYELSFDRARPGEPFWFVFSQSFSDGWQASLDGESLGPSTLVNGYANGWLIDPSSSNGVIELSFTPQRRVDLALSVSVIAALVCLLILLRTRRTPSPALVPAAPAPLDTDFLSYRGGRPAAAAAAGVAALAALGSWAVMGPLAGLVAGLLAAAGCRWAGLRRLLAAAPFLLLGVAAAYVVVWEVRYSIEVGIEWVSELERAHPIALAALVMLGVDSLVGWAWERAAEPSRGSANLQPPTDPETAT